MRYKYHWLGLAFLALGIIRLWIYARHGRHFLWLVPLLLAGTVSASTNVTLSLFNNTGTNRAWFSYVFPPGVTIFNVNSYNDANIYNALAYLSNYSGIPVVDGDKYSGVTAWAGFPTVNLSQDNENGKDVQSSKNYGSAVAAGMGVGFLWFGFGWCYRLGRKIPDC